MAIKPTGGDTPPARSRKPAPALTVEEAAPAAEAAPAEPSGGIKRSGIVPVGPTATRPGRAPATAPKRDLEASVDSWAHTGDEAVEKSLAEAQAKEADKATRIRWPRRFELKREAPDNMADIIILDARPGPRFYMHMMRGPYDDWPNTPEPCPREFEICPVCPPNGERESSFVMILSVLNMKGYTKSTGQVVPATKEILLPRTDAHIFYDALYKEHGSLRGIQLLTTRGSERWAPYIGTPKFVAKHSDEDIEAYLRENHLWDAVMKTEAPDEVLFEEGSLAKPFNYNDFVKKPSAADLLARYGGQAPAGSETANRRGGGDGQFGGGRYAPRAMPGAAPNTNFGGFGGGAAAGAELDDNVPF